jgi:hypothetical protein
MLSIRLQYGLCGEHIVLIQPYENIVNQKYHQEHPKRITGFVDKLEDAVAELLDSFDKKHSDCNMKFQFLTRNMLIFGLLAEGLLGRMVGHCES